MMRYLLQFLTWLVVLMIITTTTHSFYSPSLFASPRRTSSVVSLEAGKGFGKQPPPQKQPKKKKRSQESTEASQQPLQSINEPPPTIPDSPSIADLDTDDDLALPEIELDPSLSAEERAEMLLRQKYGIKPKEEQEAEQAVRKEAIQLQKEAKEKQQERAKKLEGWEKKAEEKDDFDIMKALPAPLLVGIDRFLKAGVAVSTTLFVAAGLGITLEAWSTATNNPLPEDVDSFIVNTVEPNFTPGLFVLLGFSVSLGVFAAAQLGSSGSQYTED